MTIHVEQALSHRSLKGTNAMRRIILSVVAGYLVITAITIVCFVVLNASKVDLHAPIWLIVKLLLSLVSASLGGLATARLAGLDRASATLILAGFMTTLSVAAMVVQFGSAPLWFLVALVLGPAPMIWLSSNAMKTA